MSDYIHLIGAEDVTRAGVNMRDAASTMQRAAESMEDSLSRQRVFMTDWLGELDRVLAARMPRRLGATGGPG